MDISEQKSCLICGTRKSIEAFRSKNGKITAICLQCLEKAGDDDQGGGGFQVNIVDKLAAITREHEQNKTDAIENFEAITERLDEQIERSHTQDNQKKYSSSLFNEKRTGEMFRTTDNKTPHQQTSEPINNNKSDTVSENSKKDSYAEKQTTATTSTRQNTLFSTSENKQPTNTNQQPITTASPDSNANKTNNATTRSSLFAVIPSAETLDKASGKSAHTNPQADSNLDNLATRFIENTLRGPGRR